MKLHLEAVYVRQVQANHVSHGSHSQHLHARLETTAFALCLSPVADSHFPEAYQCPSANARQFCLFCGQYALPPNAFHEQMLPLVPIDATHAVCEVLQWQ